MIVNIKYFISVFWLCCAAYAGSGAKEILDSLKNTTGSYKLETYNDKQQLTFTDSGDIYLRDMNELKLTSNTNEGSFVMLKDNYLWQYDNDLMQLTKAAKGFNILKDINEYGEDKVLTDKGYCLHLTHVKMPNLKLCTENNVLTSAEFYDNFGYVNKIFFVNILSNAEISDDTFIFVPSPDVEIIET